MKEDHTEEIRFVSAIGAVGGGIHEESLDEAMAQEPHFMAADAGTTDAGAYSLGSGLSAFPREMIKQDLALMLRAGKRAGVPVLVGSAGTAGGDAHVDWTLDIARQVAKENDLSIRTAVIHSEQDKSYLKQLLRENRIRPLDPAPPVDARTIDRSIRVVGMMGVEPLQRALEGGADFVLAGRCSDSALFAALPILRGFPEGLACTPQSVAAHSLYENADPYLHQESSGTLDLSKSTYEKVDDISVRIAGSAFIPRETYSVKLEGA